MRLSSNIKGALKWSLITFVGMYATTMKPVGSFVTAAIMGLFWWTYAESITHG